MIWNKIHLFHGVIIVCISEEDSDCKCTIHHKLTAITHHVHIVFITDESEMEITVSNDIPSENFFRWEYFIGRFPFPYEISLNLPQINNEWETLTHCFHHLDPQFFKS